jgi:glutamate/aspartate transport system substrate-binding protein
VNISMVVRTAAIGALALMPGAALMAQGTLERIKERGEFLLGYDPDSRPLSFVENGEPAGYSVDICRRIAVGVREHLKLPDMKITYVPLTLENRFDAVVDGKVDIECASTTMTLGRQERVDFTLMTFVTGGTFLSRAKDRIATMEDLAGKRIGVIRGVTAETALKAHLSEKLIDARVVNVADADDGLAKLQGGDIDAYASDQVVLIGDVTKALAANTKVDVSFADELFSYEPYALMVRRDDAEFRLVANRVISQIFRSGQFAQLYQEWIGSNGLQPSPLLLAMYQVQALSE